MPERKFRSVTVSAETYEKLQELARRRGTSVSKLISYLVSEFERRESENFEERLAALESRLEALEKRIGELEVKYDAARAAYEYLREKIEGGASGKTADGNELTERSAAVKSGGERRKDDKALKAFLGEVEYVKVRNTPIVVRKAEFFIEGAEPSEELSRLAEKYHAAAIPETDEEDRVIGVSIVPNTGFSVGFGNGVKLDEWFEKHGRSLLKELSARFREAT